MNTMLVAVDVCLLAGVSAVGTKSTVRKPVATVNLKGNTMLNRLKGFLLAVLLLSSAARAAAQQPSASATAADRFVPMAACRLLDTRLDLPANSAEEAVRTIDVASTRCGHYVPSGATAYAIRRTPHKRVEGDTPAPAQPAQPLERHNAGAPLHFPVAASEHLALDLEGFYVPAGAPIDPFPPASTSSGAVVADASSVPFVTAPTSKLFAPHAETLTDTSLIGPVGSLYLDGAVWGSVGFMGMATNSNSPWTIMRAGSTSGFGGFGVFDLNGTELFRVAANGVTRLKNATLSGVTDYQETASIPGDKVHNVTIVNPKDHLGGHTNPVIFFNARSPDEAPTGDGSNVSPTTTKFLAYTLGNYAEQQINFDSQFHYSWPQFQNHYYYRAWSEGEDNGANPPGKETFWVKTATSFDSIHQTRADMYVSGNIGAGTTAASAKLHVEDINNTELLVSAVDASGTGHSPTMTIMRKDNNHVQLAKYGFTLDPIDGNKLKILYGTTGDFTTTPLVIDTAGSVGIGTSIPDSRLHVNGTGHFTGNVTVDGIINAKYQDVAEWVPSDGTLPAGTVVVLNRLKTNVVAPSAKAYDTAVAGVVSDQPGVLLGVAGDNKAKIATTGRVKVHVDARTHAVNIGDLLVTSDLPGTAMLSEPLDLGGVKIHRPGTIIGKALEPLAKGEGDILVLLSLQ